MGQIATRGDVLASTVAPDQALEQRSAGEPVCTVDASAAHLTHGIQASDRASSPQIDVHAAAEVVSGRNDRDGVEGDVNTRLFTRSVDRGKALGVCALDPFPR